MRLIVEHGQVTARLNGRVLAHVPVRGLDQPWSLHLGSKYLFAQVQGLKLATRAKAAPANWTPPEVPKPPPTEQPPAPQSANDFWCFAVTRAHWADHRNGLCKGDATKRQVSQYDHVGT